MPDFIGNILATWPWIVMGLLGLIVVLMILEAIADPWGGSLVVACLVLGVAGGLATRHWRWHIGQT